MRKRHQSKKDILNSFVGVSEITKEIRGKIQEAAMEKDPVLIEGESGVGKGLAAKIIHEISGLKGKMIHVNCPSLPRELFESELFGYRKGAFTGAVEDKKGFVEEANKGTLFLDEIVDLPPNVQAKLLIFVEEGKYYRLGEPLERKVNTRIIAATNSDIKRAIKNRKFREDLFFRLSVFEIRIPPLRQRKEDIEHIMNHYKKFLRGRKLEKGAMEYIINHPLPGNVRQIINLFKRLGVRKGIITLEEVKSELERWSDLKEKKDNIVILLWERLKEGEDFWEVVWKPFLKRELKRSEVREIIRKAWISSGGRMKKAVELMGIKNSEYKKFLVYLKRYDLSPFR